MAKAGQPQKYKNADEMQKAIDTYFNGGAYKRKVVTALGQVVEIPTPTITDLVLYLGFVNRQSFYDYEKRAEFSDTIKRARSRIELEYEILLRNQSCTGAIFALKNFGWIDRSEQKIEKEVTVTHKVELVDLTERIDQIVKSRICNLTN